MRKNPEENARQVDCPVAISIEPAIRHDEVDATKRVALVAIHGMGQQLPFETIDDALEGIYGPQTRASVTGVRAAFVSTDSDTTATVRDTLEPRVRLDIVRNDADGASSSVGVDVYEVHWSDFTSKATSALETYWFLVVSACSGVAFKLTPGRLVKPYVRWVDGVELRPDIPTWHILMLCLAMLYLALFWAMRLEIKVSAQQE